MFDQFLQESSIFIFYFPLVSHRGYLFGGGCQVIITKATPWNKVGKVLGSVTLPVRQ